MRKANRRSGWRQALLAILLLGILGPAAFAMSFDDTAVKAKSAPPQEEPEPLVFTSRNEDTSEQDSLRSALDEELEGMTFEEPAPPPKRTERQVVGAAEPIQNKAPRTVEPALAPQRTAPRRQVYASDPEEDAAKRYVLKTGDRVKIKVFPEDDYVKGGETVISEEGHIRITTAGKFNIASKTIRDAEMQITKVLLDYFVEPEVTIEVLESEERTIVFLGEVKSPGTYPIPVGRDNFTLMEGLALAGGFSEVANIKKISVTRKTETGESLRLRANAEDILQGKAEDIILEPDDIIHVKESFF